MRRSTKGEHRSAGGLRGLPGSAAPAGDDGGHSRVHLQGLGEKIIAICCKVIAPSLSLLSAQNFDVLEAEKDRSKVVSTLSNGAFCISRLLLLHPDQGPGHERLPDVHRPLP